MRRWLSALVPWMVMTVALAQTPVPVGVDYTFRGTFSDESVRLGDECWINPSLFEKWGFAVLSNGNTVDVSGHDRKFQLPVQRLSDKEWVCLDEAARYLGAVVEWNEDKSVYRVRAQVRNLEQTEYGLRVDATLPVKASIFKIATPDRLVIDLSGARLPISLGFAIPSNWRIRQFEKDTVRVVVQSPEMAKQFLPTLEPDRTLRVIFGDESAQSATFEDEASVGGLVTPDPIENIDVSVERKAAASVSMPNLAKEDETSAVFMMPFTGKLLKSASASFLDPKKIQIKVPSADLSTLVATQLFESKFVMSATASRNDKGEAVIVFDLHERAAFELKSNERILTLRLFRPKEASGKLANKVIVVDAGHGGTETGTKWGELLEKSINLKVAKLLATNLTAEGASVVMIRDDDSNVPLLSRPETANQSKADLYVSVHVNSNRTAGSVSGGITFYHMQDSTSMLFAQCVQTEIAKVSKLPDMGVWSDSRIYKKKGFAVLRGASMPAILIEMGFINHPTDRKRIVQSSFHEDVARAIVDGIKIFIGDNHG